MINYRFIAHAVLSAFIEDAVAILGATVIVMVAR
jgi:hypothetical protein